ncbi:response regulator [Thalassospira sp. MA62]|nr:response regulator [Thalassospira sp. MA62]
MPFRRVLVVDDDPDITNLLDVYLSEEGFEVSLAATEAELWMQLESKQFDLILLDILLPDGDGFAVTRRLREIVDSAIILISRKDTDIDQIVGLELGADDYVVKPLVLRTLLARIKSVLRRYNRASPPSAENVEMTGDEMPVSLSEMAESPKQEDKIRIGNWVLDRVTLRMKHRDGRQLVVSSNEAALIAIFVENQGRVIGRTELMQILRGRQWEYMDRSIDLMVTRLRRKIEDDPSDPQIIQTVRGSGYVYQPTSL